MLEARINFIESRMPRFNVIDLATLGGDQVTFGATVEIEDVDTGDVKKYTCSARTKPNRARAPSPCSRPWAKPCLASMKGMRSWSTPPGQDQLRDRLHRLQRYPEPFLSLHPDHIRALPVRRGPGREHDRPSGPCAACLKTPDRFSRAGGPAASSWTRPRRAQRPRCARAPRPRSGPRCR
jgi:hypothetical protein